MILSSIDYLTFYFGFLYAPAHLTIRTVSELTAYFFVMASVFLQDFTDFWIAAQSSERTCFPPHSGGCLSASPTSSWTLSNTARGARVRYGGFPTVARSKPSPRWLARLNMEAQPCPWKSVALHRNRRRISPFSAAPRGSHLNRPPRRRRCRPSSTTPAAWGIRWSRRPCSLFVVGVEHKKAHYPRFKEVIGYASRGRVQAENSEFNG